MSHDKYQRLVDAAKALLDIDHPPTAIFAANDDMAAATAGLAHHRDDTKVQRLPIEPVSRASAAQRAGRQQQRTTVGVEVGPHVAGFGQGGQLEQLRTQGAHIGLIVLEATGGLPAGFPTQARVLVVEADALRALQGRPGAVQVRMWGADAAPLPATVREVAASAERLSGRTAISWRSVSSASKRGIERRMAQHRAHRLDEGGIFRLTEGGRVAGDRAVVDRHRVGATVDVVQRRESTRNGVDCVVASCARNNINTSSERTSITLLTC